MISAGRPMLPIKKRLHETGAGDLHPNQTFCPAPGPFQPLFIALLLLMMACMLGSLCLLATGRVVPPL
jgi:hypothetical protein